MTAGVFRDTARTLRSWRRTPGSALLVVLAIGLSGGALLTLVSLFNALFWRQLPLPHPGELVGISGTDRRIPDSQSISIPVSLFTSLGPMENVFQAFAGFGHVESIAVIRNTSQRLALEGVSGRYFDMLGVRPTLGEFITVRDVETASPVATISFRCWQTRFGADRDVIGQTFRVRGELLTVIGVAPRAFTGLKVGIPADAWVPESVIPRLLQQSPSLNMFEALVGRLRPGVTIEDATRQLESLWPTARDVAAAEVGTAVPQARAVIRELQPRTTSAARGFSAFGALYRRTLLLLVLCSAVTVLLSCANLSGLLLARWSIREVDLAVQAALGASNGRLVSQVVGESLTLSVGAVILTAPVALWSAKILTLLLLNPADAVSPLDLSPDYRVLAAMAGLAGFVAVCVSLLPASQIWSAKPMLLRGIRGVPGPGVTRWGRWLTAAQVALAVPLLVTAWTVAANLQRLHGANTGFRWDGVLVANLTSQSAGVPRSDPTAYFTQLASALRAVPGIAAVALTWNEPLSFGADYRRRPIVGRDGLEKARPFVLQVSPGYFETLRVPLVAGRDFLWTDDRGQRDVAIVSAGLAKAVWPGADPVGRSVRLGGQTDRLLEVIGVVAEAKLAEPHAPNQLFLFTALLQEPPRLLELQSPVVLLKSPLPPSSVDSPARRAIVGLGRDEVFEIHPLQHTMDAALLRERVMRLGAFYFAGVTTLLVFVGLYSVVNLQVMRRIPEIGLRLALGASIHDIRMLVIREAAVTAAAGLVLGVPLSFLSGRLLAASLTLADPHDAIAFATAIAVILAIAGLSVLTPIHRATNIAPLEALGSR